MIVFTSRFHLLSRALIIIYLLYDNMSREHRATSRAPIHFPARILTWYVARLAFGVREFLITYRAKALRSPPSYFMRRQRGIGAFRLIKIKKAQLLSRMCARRRGKLNSSSLHVQRVINLNFSVYAQRVISDSLMRLCNKSRNVEFITLITTRTVRNCVCCDNLFALFAISLGDLIYSR